MQKEHTTWDEFNQRVSDAHFRRMFRMSRECSSLLCSTIIGKVGESTFKSEAYLDAFLRDESVDD